jgi:hypothetical protein
MAHEAPEPPSDIETRPLPLEILSAGTVLFRIHSSVNNPKFFGRSKTWRFDSPDESYGTLYLGMSAEACFAETLLRGLSGFVARSELEIRSLCRFTAVRELRLVRVHGPHIAMLAATAGVAANPDYGLCQRWSRALHSHRQRPDGIIYKSNYDNDELVSVLFDRAHDAIDRGSSSPIMSDVQLLGRILNRYRASIR